MSFTWLNLGDGTGICIVTQNPSVAVPGTLLKVIFLAAIVSICNLGSINGV